MHQLFDRMSKQELKDAIVGGTDEFKDIYENGIEGDAGGDKTAKELAEILGDFGTISDYGINRVVAIYNDARRPIEKPDLSKEKLVFCQFAAVVPLRNKNDHNYIIGDPVVMMVGRAGENSGMRGLKLDGSIGSLLPRFRKSLRPATDAEIDRLVNAFYRMS